MDVGKWDRCVSSDATRRGWDGIESFADSASSFVSDESDVAVKSLNLYSILKCGPQTWFTISRTSLANVPLIRCKEKLFSALTMTRGDMFDAGVEQTEKL